jgi:ketosteroid isomerase-like protein
VSAYDRGVAAREDERGDRDAVWAAVLAIYDGFLADDRDAIDANIAPEATMWDAFHEPLVRGKAGLDAVRDARPGDGPRPAELRAEEPVIDVFGDVALVRHLLTVVTPGEPELRLRNTGLWRRDGGRWLCVHNHEDLLA